MDERMARNDSGAPNSDAPPDATARSVRRRLWGGTALLFLAAVFGLAAFGAQEAPKFRVEGLTPGAWQESTGGTGAPAIHFGTNPPCMFQGPRYAEVRAALANARAVTIECGEGMLGAIVIGVEVDGVTVLAQREVASIWTRDSWLAPAGLVVCALGGIALFVAAIMPSLRRGRPARRGAPGAG
jgi:hypothetical protein